MGANRNERLFWIGLVGIVLAFMLLRFFPFFRLVLMALLFLAMLVFLILSLTNSYQKRKEDKAFKRSTIGQVKIRIDYCGSQIEKNKGELEQIKRDIQELERNLDAGIEIAPQHKKEGASLIEAFRSELQLRETKISFFETCVRKLEILLHNHTIAQQITEKKKALEQLKENHYEELAAMEALRTQVEMDTHYLNTIRELSSQMFLSQTVDDALLLKVELEKMTSELENT
ncbi:MAG: hypothetical protein R2828_27670 [Saprospiraceae bacterium]